MSVNMKIVCFSAIFLLGACEIVNRYDEKLDITFSELKSVLDSPYITEYETRYDWKNDFSIIFYTRVKLYEYSKKIGEEIFVVVEKCDQKHKVILYSPARLVDELDNGLFRYEVKVAYKYETDFVYPQNYNLIEEPAELCLHLQTGSMGRIYYGERIQISVGENLKEYLP